ncbi:MAG: hypothetical protein Fur0042_07380 [Cyanophyceae cyanobacterium]
MATGTGVTVEHFAAGTTLGGRTPGRAAASAIAALVTHNVILPPMGADMGPRFGITGFGIAGFAIDGLDPWG